jgi:cellulose biosynthesis protein BcsQ
MTVLTERAPLVAATPVPHLDRTLKAAADNGADLVIIDTAGRTSEAASAAARAADLILVPLQPSLIDLKPSARPSTSSGSPEAGRRAHC